MKYSWIQFPFFFTWNIFSPTLAMFQMKQFNKRYILNPSVSHETNSIFSLKISYLFPEQFHYRLCAFQTLPFHVKLKFLIFLYDSDISNFSQFFCFTWNSKLHCIIQFHVKQQYVRLVQQQFYSCSRIIVSCETILPVRLHCFTWNNS